MKLLLFIRVNSQVLFTCNIDTRTAVLFIARRIREIFPDPHDQQYRRHDNGRKHGGGTEYYGENDSEKGRKEIVHGSKEACDMK